MVKYLMFRQIELILMILQSSKIIKTHKKNFNPSTLLLNPSSFPKAQHSFSLSCCLIVLQSPNLKKNSFASFATLRAINLTQPQKKRASLFSEALGLIWQRPTFPLGVAVSSAMQGLTSLFGMVRGVHLLYNHQKYL
mgnify:CR=1 FL=1